MDVFGKTCFWKEYLSSASCCCKSFELMQGIFWHIKRIIFYTKGNCQGSCSSTYDICRGTIEMLARSFAFELILPQAAWGKLLSCCCMITYVQIFHSLACVILFHFIIYSNKVYYCYLRSSHTFLC